ncbi:MAG: hypothetical protein KDN18_07945 [Verrucomicrobiae bacterium]|nr:hypothetical protein [Verrucomicrobiae bacterium]
MKCFSRRFIQWAPFQGLIVAIGLTVAVGEEHDDHHEHQHPRPPVIQRDEAERIHESSLTFEIHRDGTVEFEQRFRVGVAGTAIKRGPVLNFLTAFQGPAGLVLDSELEVLGVERDGADEPFRLERGAGYATVFIGSPDRELEHRIHEYRVSGRMREDWRRGPGEFSTTFDLVGSLPLLPVDRAEAMVRMPEGIQILWFTPGITGTENPDKGSGPAFALEQGDGWVKVWSTAPMGENRSFFLNLAWQSSSFATRSQWPLIIRQHPRLLLAGLSAILLFFALGLLLRRMANRR